VSAWLTKSLSQFVLEGERNSWRCLMRKFAKSALGQSKRTCSSSCTQCQLHLVQILSSKGTLCSFCRRRSTFKLWPESLSLERARKRWLGMLCRWGTKAELVWLRVSDRPTSQANSLWALQNGCDKSSWFCWIHLHHVDESDPDLSILGSFAHATTVWSHSFWFWNSSWKQRRAHQSQVFHEDHP